MYYILQRHEYKVASPGYRLSSFVVCFLVALPGVLVLTNEGRLGLSGGAEGEADEVGKV